MSEFDGPNDDNERDDDGESASDTRKPSEQGEETPDREPQDDRVSADELTQDEIAALNERITAFESTVAALESELDDVESNVETTQSDIEGQVNDLRSKLDEFEDSIDDRTVHRKEIEKDLKRYVRKRVRRGHATGWGPYLVLLYGTAMTLGAFYFLSSGWAVLAMLVIWLSTLGLYTLMVLVGVTIKGVGLPGRALDAVRGLKNRR